MNDPAESGAWRLFRLSNVKLILAIGVWTASAYAQDLNYRSPFVRVEMAPDQPNFRVLSVDSLGKDKLDVNVMLPLAAGGAHYEASRKGATIEYRRTGDSTPVWTFIFSEQGIVIRSTYSANTPPQPLVLSFDPKGSHATLLGLFTEEGEIKLPALLHLPDRGTFRITTAAKDVALGYDALRFRKQLHTCVVSGRRRASA